ncbi:hypothetical protein QC762_302090 [Podospora pseudocomata]|nr:hypothetical protein QC762_302090 [Podospora pseudocomata]
MQRTPSSPLLPDYLSYLSRTRHLYVTLPTGSDIEHIMSHQPTVIKEGEWQDGLCGCCSGGHFWMGCCCPCILVNKTHELLENPSNPSPSGCGMWGCAWCGLNFCGGWGWILECLQRGEVRSKHRIEGSGCTDCLVACCCPCCGVIQSHKEVEKRRDAMQGGVPDKMGYQGQAPMRA